MELTGSGSRPGHEQSNGFARSTAPSATAPAPAKPAPSAPPTPPPPPRTCELRELSIPLLNGEVIMALKAKAIRALVRAEEAASKEKATLVWSAAEQKVPVTAAAAEKEYMALARVLPASGNAVAPGSDRFEVPTTGWAAAGSLKAQTARRGRGHKEIAARQTARRSRRS